MAKAMTPKGRTCDLRAAANPTGYAGAYTEVVYAGVVVSGFGDGFGEYNVATALQRADKVIEETGLAP